MFKPNTLYYSDGYKTAHKRMMAPGTDYLYGTFIPRSDKRAPKGINAVVSIGQKLALKWLHDEFKENFFSLSKGEALMFAKDMSMYLGMDYDGKHFGELHAVGYLPIRVKSLSEGIETPFGIPHMTFINTKKGFAWLTLYLETIISALYWKVSTAATLSKQYKRNATGWVIKTDPANIALVDFMCHDFSSRGLDPYSMIACGLGHAASFRGSDSLIVIPAARYFYDEPMNEVCINSVNASEHSVSTTKIFTVGEKQMIIDWLEEFPKGILSIVADTFDLWKLLLDYIADPEVKALIMARDGKLVIRPDSGNPVDIICGTEFELVYDENEAEEYQEELLKHQTSPEGKGVIEILWDIFGGTVNEQGYKCLDSHIGCIYGDAINLERQVNIYSRLASKGFAATNILLGVGSYTYQYVTRDTFGFAVKGAWFSADGIGHDIYKNPITDTGNKKSLKGRCAVFEEDGTLIVKTECTTEEEAQGLLQVLYEDGIFHNEPTLAEIRERMEACM